MERHCVVLMWICILITFTAATTFRLKARERGSNHIANDMDCPDGLVIDPDTGVCTWMFEAEKYFSCRHRPDGIYPSPFSRNAYFICDGHYSHLRYCPPHWVFNLDKGGCVRDSVASFRLKSREGGSYHIANDMDCPDGLVFDPDTGVCTWMFEAEKYFSCKDRADGIYACPFSRNAYFICERHNTHLMFCPPRWVFNPDKGECEDSMASES